MKIITLDSGLKSYHYSKAEQDETWKELEQDISIIGKNIPTTTGEGLIYFIDHEIEISFDKFKVTIRIPTGQTKTFTCTLCNKQNKMQNEVRKLYKK